MNPRQENTVCIIREYTIFRVSPLFTTTFVKRDNSAQKLLQFLQPDYRRVILCNKDFANPSPDSERKYLNWHTKHCQSHWNPLITALRQISNHHIHGVSSLIRDNSWSMYSMIHGQQTVHSSWESTPVCQIWNRDSRATTHISQVISLTCHSKISK